jgi:hypothetical protein
LNQILGTALCSGFSGSAALWVTAVNFIDAQKSGKFIYEKFYIKLK